MPIPFFKLASSVATTWKMGKAIYDWSTNAPLKRDTERLLSNLEHRRVLYAEWQYESMPAVLHSLSDILREVRTFRSNHPDNVELGALLGDLIISLQSGLGELHSFNINSDAGEFRAYRVLLKIRSELAKTLAILCGKTGVSPHGGDLQKFVMDMALVRPRA